MSISKLNLSLNPLELFLRIPAEIHGLAFLISDGSFDARWSMLAWNPKRTIHEIPEMGDCTSNSSDLPFQGGFIGSIDYEYGYELLDLQAPTPTTPITFSEYDHALLFDHHQSQWHLVGGSEKEVLSWTTREPHFETQKLSLEPTWTKETYLEKFSILKKSITEGEIYQGCLTFPFTGKAVNDTRSLFAQLTETNPSSMGMYLEQPFDSAQDRPGRTILSLSPERFLLWDGKSLETKPIKGTRPRGKTEAESLQHELELLSDAKETAELSMVTDLLRNDLAKVCKPGTVKVLEQQAIQICPKVIHTYSHIRGETMEQTKVKDIIQATFPGGSITGCPKRKAMEILAKLETADRGIYTGCLGYLSTHGRMDLNIAIRTLVQQGDTVTASFGGGIVADSVGEREYEECFTKAATFHTS